VSIFLKSLEGDRWAAIYYLACTGMRKGEILGLPLSALKLEEGYLMVVQTLQFIPGRGRLLMPPKTEKSKRLIRLPEFIKEALRIHLARRVVMSQNPSWKESGLVFTSDIGTPIFPSNMVAHFKEKMAEAGVPKIRFHDLRHTVASLLSTEKMSIQSS
jgi:integrase